MVSCATNWANCRIVVAFINILKLNIEKRTASDYECDDCEFDARSGNVIFYLILFLRSDKQSAALSVDAQEENKEESGSNGVS